MVRSQEERLRRKLSHTRAWGLRWSGGDDSLVGCVFMYSSHDPVSGGAGHARVSGMVTSPDHRRRGLAKVLMEALMEEAGQMPLSLNATTMGKPLYDSLGFRDLDGYVEWSSSTAAAKHRPTAAQVEQLAQQAGATLTVVRAPKAADAELVRRLDTAVFGGDRGELLQDTFTDGGVGGVLVVARRRAVVMMDGRSEAPEPDVIGYCHSAANPRWGRFIAPVVARSPEVRGTARDRVD
jgi:GNAT superfamily N-acetyltransferase